MIGYAGRFKFVWGNLADKEAAINEIVNSDKSEADV